MPQTLQRINKALDLRFEKDASLYIDKETIDAVKKYIYEQEYQNISALSRKYEPLVLAKTILKNCFLLDLKGKNSKKILRELFNAIDPSDFIAISADILANKIYCTPIVKTFVLEYVVGGYGEASLKSSIHNEHICIKDRFVYFSELVYRIRNSKGEVAAVEYIDDTLLVLRELYRFIEKSHHNFVGELIDNRAEGDIKRVAEYIVNEVLGGDNSPLFEGVVKKYPEKSMTFMAQNIKRSPYYNSISTKHIIKKIFPKIAEAQSVRQDFPSIVKELYCDCLNLRVMFLDMLNDRNIKEHSYKLQILAGIEQIGIPAKWQDRVEQIKNSQSKKYETIEETLGNLKLNVHDLKNKKTLSFFSVKIDGHLPLFLGEQSHPNVRSVLAFYFAQKPDLIEKNNVSIATDLKKSIADTIIEFHMKNAQTRLFLENNRYFDHLAQFE